MIGLTALNKPSSASEYYTKDNYYTSGDLLGPSEWQGKGAELLGLIGNHNQNVKYDFAPEKTVSPETFEKLLLGKINEDTQLRSQKGLTDKKQTAGTDITFGAPKSVSIVALLEKNPRVIEAFKKSVKDTIEYAEKNYASIYQNSQKNVGAKQTDNLTVATFTHDTNRLLEPHLHAHAVVINMTQNTETGEWRSHNNRAFYQNRYMMTYYFHRKLEKNLNDLGIQTERQADGRFEISGVSRDMIEHFSTRSKDIRENVGTNASWYEKSVAALNTRDPKININRNELEGYWKDKYAESGYLVDKTVMNSYSSAGQQDISKVFKSAIRILQSQSNTFKNIDIMKTAQGLADKALDVDIILKHIDRHALAGTLINHDQNAVDARERTYTTPINVNAEISLIERVQNDRGNSRLLPVRYDLNKAINKDASELNPSQRHVVKDILSSDEKYLAVIGPPGTGKTFTLGKAVKLMNNISPFVKNNKILNLAPTLNATAELKQATKGEGSTIQKFIAKYENRTSPNVVASDKKDFENTVAMLDESSMLSNVQMEKYKIIAERLGIKKTLYIGDTNQNGAIPAGSPLAAMIDNGLKTTKIETILRQRNKTLNEAVTALGNKNFPVAWKGFDVYAKEDVNFIDNAVKSYVSAIERNKDTMLVALDNQTRIQLNEGVQLLKAELKNVPPKTLQVKALDDQYINKEQSQYISQYQPGQYLAFKKDIYNTQIQKGELWNIKSVNAEQGTLTLEHENKEDFVWTVQKAGRDLPFSLFQERKINFNEGDRIIMRGDEKDIDFKRGQRGYVKKVTESGVTFGFSNKKPITLDKNSAELKRVDLDYAITSYNSQGQSADFVIAAIDTNSGAIGYESTLVALSREKDDLEIHTNDWQKVKQASQNERNDDIAIKNFESDLKEQMLKDLGRNTPKKDLSRKAEELEQDLKLDFLKDLNKVGSDKSNNQPQKDIENTIEQTRSL